MSVKTAEEKLREMLEGEPLKTAKHESRKEAQFLDAAKQDKRDKQDAEAFIQDFEKKLPPLKIKPKPVKKAAQQNNESTSQAVSKPEAPQVIANNEPDISEIDTSYIDEPEILPDNSINNDEDLPIIANDDNNESESEPAQDSESESESESEQEQQENESEPEPENLPDIPVIDENSSEQDDELPVIPVIDKSEENDESEPAPISVTMPESTATAEDKLMADIAEAMTGSPLTLESDNNEPYNLPDFSQDDNDQQTAEEKLRANIAQAMTESPLDIAKDNINQNLEQDLNPFDDLPEFKPENLPDPEINNEPEPEPFIPDFNENDSAQENESESESESEPENLPELEIDDSPDPEPIEIENIDLPVQEVNQEIEPDISPMSESEINNDPEPEPDFSSFNIDLDDDINDINQVEPDISLEPEINNLESEAEAEAESEQESENLPSLLNDPDEHEDNDDFDISSLGALSEAASIIGDEHEHDNTDDFISGQENNQPAPVSESVVINNINPEEEKSNQKFMSIRDKLKNRQNGEGKSWGGLITALLLAALLIVGIMLYFKIGSLANGITIEQAPQIAQEPDTYEYAIDFILDQNLPERMTQRGKASWQVVGSRRTQDTTSGQYGYEFIFMRKVRGK